MVAQEIGGRIVGIFVDGSPVLHFDDLAADTFGRIHRVAFHAGSIILRQEGGVMGFAVRIVDVYCVKHIFARDDQIGHSSG